MQSEKHIVTSDTRSIRLSDYGPGIFPGLSTKSAFKKAIKKGEIMVDKQPGTTGHIVKPGEVITWNTPDDKPVKIYHIDLEVVYEDETLGVVNKPAGVVVSGNQFRTLENALPLHLEPSSHTDALVSPKAIHRLDAPTSGLIIIAKTAAARVKLSRLMEQKEIHKTYQALVIGETQESWSSETPVDEKPATTLFRKIRTVPSLRSETLTMVEAKPLTGRTHQIRKHLSEAGTPILGDKMYGKEGLILKGKGLFLCATQVAFPHPFSGEPISIKIDPPHKFEHFMQGEKRRWEKYRM
ncbi:RluA family pseudouridine synthase [Marinilabilia salmonicolor]|uniref:23S rRNA pseudouridine1911/1915/1917 synthase n=1 Tax=Marinilabilia salmonicolor TaxID=989 RepID=A0A368UPT1_9BACT|nr:RluA family pseudouridine synthase [Marinilabilia salmonicolor]RCW30806.1 23S rRNA pseudouridine1911/1915/1917 synthase [Marinilabilia salmonicolor]